MKEHSSQVNQSDDRLKNNMKLIRPIKYNGSCFCNNRYCDSVVVISKKHKNVFKFKHSTLLVIIVLLFGFTRVDSKNNNRERGKDPKHPNDVSNCWDCRSNASNDVLNCWDCHINASREMALVNLQNKILHTLGYPEPPPKGSNKDRLKYMAISRFMEKQYDETTTETRLRHHPTEAPEEQLSIQPRDEFAEGKPCFQCPPYDGIHTPIIFRLENTTIKNDNYKSVSLMLYANNSEHCKDQVAVNVYQLVYSPDGSKTYRHVKATENDSQPVTQILSANMSWITLDVQHEITNHKLNPSFSDNITFVPVITYVSKRGPHCPDLNGNTSFYSLLKFQYDDKVKKRSKRTLSNSDCKADQNHTNCCRYPLTVDFDAMQWDFIITPRKYEAYHCDGECPFLYKQSIPHTHLAQQMKTKVRVGPCCSPKKMNPLNMLYITPRGTILYGKVGDMVVESCGCS